MGVFSIMGGRRRRPQAENTDSVRFSQATQTISLKKKVQNKLLRFNTRELHKTTLPAWVAIPFRELAPVVTITAFNKILGTKRKGQQWSDYPF